MADKKQIVPQAKLRKRTDLGTHPTTYYILDENNIVYLKTHSKREWEETWDALLAQGHRELQFHERSKYFQAVIVGDENGYVYLEQPRIH